MSRRYPCRFLLCLLLVAAQALLSTIAIAEDEFSLGKARAACTCMRDCVNDQRVIDASSGLGFAAISDTCSASCINACRTSLLNLNVASRLDTNERQQRQRLHDFACALTPEINYLTLSPEDRCRCNRRKAQIANPSAAPAKQTCAAEIVQKDADDKKKCREGKCRIPPLSPYIAAEAPWRRSWLPSPAGPELGASIVQQPAPDAIQWSEALSILFDVRCNSLRGCADWIKRAVLPGRKNLPDATAANDVQRSAARLSVDATREATATVDEAIGNTVLEARRVGNNTVAATEQASKKLGENLKELTETIKRTDSPTQPVDTKDSLIGSIKEGNELISGQLSELGSDLQSINQTLQLLADARKPKDPDAVPEQIAADADLIDEYGDAERIGYAILLVPYPVVPRHRRSYDLAIDAVNRGMLEEGFVLDRHSFPWQSYLDKTPIDKTPKPDAAGGRSNIDSTDDQFGLMVFRRDDWRSQQPADDLHHRYTIRAIYVVPETASYGIQKEAFQRARNLIWRRTSQCPTVDGKATQNALGVSGTAASTRTARDIVVIGPNFSGSISSLAAAAMEPVEEVICGGKEFRDETNQLRAAIQAMDLQAAAQLASLQRIKARKSRVAVQGLRTLLKVISDNQWTDKNFKAELDAQLDALDLGGLKDGASMGSVNGVLGGWVQRIKNSRASPLPPVCVPTSVEKTCSDPGPRLVAVSPSTTSTTNALVVSRWENLAARLQLHALAVNDKEKLDWVDLNFAATSVSKDAPSEVVLLTESTSFGIGLCPQRSPDYRSNLCDRAVELRFASNIADIRYGRRTLRDAQESMVRGKLPFPNLPSGQLFEGSENGSEFPYSQQSPLTVSGAERELERVLANVREIDPRVVVVAATDVRDRLFLFELLRAYTPRAQLIDLEADLLLSHPDYVNSSRGALMLASSPLNLEVANAGDTSAANATSRYQAHESFATDRQALTFQIVRKFVELDASEARLKLCPVDSSLKGVAAIFPLDSTTIPQCWQLPVGPTALAVGKGRIGNAMDLRGWAGDWRRSGPSHSGPANCLVVALLLILGVTLWCFVRALAGSAEMSAVSASRRRRRCVNTVIVSALVASGWWTFARLDGNASGWGSERLPTLEPLLAAWISSAVLLIAALLTVRIVGSTFQLPACLRCNLFSEDFPRRVVIGGALPFRTVLLLPVLAMLVAGAWMTVNGMLNIRTSLLGNLEGVLFAIQVAICLIAILGLWSAGALTQGLLRVAYHLGHSIPRVGKEHGPTDWEALPGNGLAIAATPDLGYWHRPDFALTPLLAVDYSYRLILERMGLDHLGESGNAAFRALALNYEDSVAARCRFSAVLASQVTAVRDSIVLSLVCAFGVIGLGYAYPVSSRDHFLLLSLLVLVVAALWAAYAVIALERQPLISRLLSNTNRGVAFSLTLLSTVMAPIVLVAVSIAVLEIPGVLEWSGGLFGFLFSWLKQ